MGRTFNFYKNIALSILLIFIIHPVSSQTYGWKELGRGDKVFGASKSIHSICISGFNNIAAINDIDSYQIGGHGGYVSYWNGTDWSQLGILNEDICSAICADANSNVYVATGTLVDLSLSYAVHRWAGSGWISLRNGIESLGAVGTVNGICTNEAGEVYIAGENGIVEKWSDSSWIEIGGFRFGSPINCICTDTSSIVYVAGQFTDTSGYNYVAKWNGSGWSELGTGNAALNVDSQILSICIDSTGNVYAAGAFIDTNGYYYVAKWNGSSWSELGSLQANGPINSICCDAAGNLYAAGNFTHSGYNYVAKWNGSSWSELGTGFGALNANGAINSICVSPAGNVYAGGAFTDSAGFECVAEYGPLEPTGIFTNATTFNNFNVYPNPANDAVYISFNNNFTTGKILLSDITGQTIYTTAYNGQATQKLDISQLAAGVYLISLQNENARVVKKFVKE